jgi:hypothetical protein
MDVVIDKGRRANIDRTNETCTTRRWTGQAFLASYFSHVKPSRAMDVYLCSAKSLMYCCEELRYLCTIHTSFVPFNNTYRTQIYRPHPQSSSIPFPSTRPAKFPFPHHTSTTQRPFQPIPQSTTYLLSIRYMHNLTQVPSQPKPSFPHSTFSIAQITLVSSPWRTMPHSIPKTQCPPHPFPRDLKSSNNKKNPANATRTKSLKCLRFVYSQDNGLVEETKRTHRCTWKETHSTTTYKRDGRR